MTIPENPITGEQMSAYDRGYWSDMTGETDADIGPSQVPQFRDGQRIAAQDIADGEVYIREIRAEADKS